jgi:hypothetical protein
MYPQVTQFETRDLLVRQELELLRARRRAARGTDAKPRLCRRALRPALLVGTLAAALHPLATIATPRSAQSSRTQ